MRLHRLYLLQNDVIMTSYAPNFHLPYVAKINRSLIRSIINKSWDTKRRD